MQWYACRFITLPLVTAAKALLGLKHLLGFRWTYSYILLITASLEQEIVSEAEKELKQMVAYELFSSYGLLLSPNLTSALRGRVAGGLLLMVGRVVGGC